MALRKFPIDEHDAKIIKRHPQWPEYGRRHEKLPWYEEEFTSMQKVSCSHCTQGMNAYSYRFRNTWCQNLINLSTLMDIHGSFRWAHTSEFAATTEKLSGIKMGAWLVVEGMGNLPPGSSKKSSGMYRLTQVGWMFINGQCGIPKRLIQYLGNNIALSGPLVSFGQCRKQKFHYGKEIEGNE